MQPPHAITLSQQLLLAVKQSDETQPIELQLAELAVGQLKGEVATDAQKLAFWINCYNAFAVLSLRSDPTVLTRPLARHLHFFRKFICIAGQQLSLDAVEHGMLRHSKMKVAKGYIENPLPSTFERQFRVTNFDNRIHFALNCGGSSCPPIRFYEPDKIDVQLELATRAFLETEASYDTSSHVVRVSRLLHWYLGDFGGKVGLLGFLRKYALIPSDTTSPKIEWLAYDWTPELGNWAS